MSAQPYAGLRKKLVAVDDVEMGGVCEVTVLRNPDGPEAAEAISSLLKRVGELEGLISAESIERLAEDIAIACVDCLPPIREARHRAMVRLGERLRTPLPNDLKHLAALNSDASTQTVGGD
jgi:hypothetical protein